MNIAYRFTNSSLDLVLEMILYSLTKICQCRFYFKFSSAWTKQNECWYNSSYFIIIHIQND